MPKTYLCKYKQINSSSSMKYPIGIQSFKKLREGGYVYVDKTELIYNLVQQGQYIFLSRPRRFGKSLVLSTIEAYFEGRKDLFEGLAMAELEKDWKPLPVIRIDFNTGKYSAIDGLLNRLDKTLTEQEKKHGQQKVSNDSGLRFEYLIKNIYESTGNKVVVLIDEYDKPLLETIGTPDLQEKMRDELRDFYSVLKSCDDYIHFAMLTGVTKFGHLSVFSGLNNIIDISFHSEYAALCGITETEMLSCFAEPIQEMAANNECSAAEMVEMLRKMYDGYRFTRDKVLVYNPFSILNAFLTKNLDAYWFATGTPKYLVELLQKNRYDLNNLEGVSSSSSKLSAFNPDTGDDPIPVMYQSGYLTIRDFDQKRNRITLDFPNEEVRIGFMEYLYPFYAKTKTKQRFAYEDFRDEIEDGKAEDFMRRLQALTADMSYEILAHCENDFQNLLFIIFSLASIKPTVERRTSDGRIDMVVETEKFVYVMEYKVDGTAQDAMSQINSKNYSLPWTADQRPVIKIGANFSTTERRLTEYLIEG